MHMAPQPFQVPDPLASAASVAAVFTAAASAGGTYAAPRVVKPMAVAARDDRPMTLEEDFTFVSKQRYANRDTLSTPSPSFSAARIRMVRYLLYNNGHSCRIGDPLPHFIESPAQSKHV